MARELGKRSSRSAKVILSSCRVLSRTRQIMTLSVSLTASLFLLFFVGTVQGHGSHDHTANEVPMCGTVDLDPTQLRRIADIPKKKASKIQSRIVGGPTPPPYNITIDTYICIVTDTLGYGDVAASVLSQQIDVLNSNFANSSSVFRFQLKGIKRFQQPNAYTTALNDYVNQLGLSCHQGGIDALNIFIVPNIDSTATSTTLGLTLPFFVYGVDYVDGVYIYRNTLPGMIFPRVDHGITCVHEVGHWLGLMHPFQSLGIFESDPCNPANPQDYIADTPLMATPSYGCPVGKDSCPNATGLDPSNNFMDYSDDYDASGKQCRVMFTPEQVARMEDVWNYYRVQNEICAIDELQFDLQFQFDNFPSDISWTLELRNGTLVHSSTPDELGNTYSSYFAGQTININRCLPRSRYILTILDAGHNGIARPGFYQLSVDGVVAARGGQDFKSAVSILFGSSTHVPDANATNDDNFNTTVVVQIDVSSGSCFSGANTVEVAHKGVITISKLEIGDLVRDASGNMVRVYSFGHYHTTKKTDYLQIHAKGLLQPLEISNDHLVFVDGVSTPASRVAVGDRLDLDTGRTFASVTKVENIIRIGAFAPFTTSGTIMVNGVAASSYVTLQQDSDFFMLGSFKTPISMHQLAHIFLTPQRLACRFTSCKSENYTGDGISNWVVRPLKASKWLVRQNPWIAVATLLPALLVALLFWVVELLLLCCLRNPLLAVMLAVLIIRGKLHSIASKIL